MSDDEERSPWTRIARLLAGELTGEEREEARRELQADAEIRERLEDAEAIWRLTSGPAGQQERWDGTAGWKELRERVGSRAAGSGTGPAADAGTDGATGSGGGRSAAGEERPGSGRRDRRRRGRPSGLRTALKAAAAVLLVAGGWWAWEAGPLSETSPDRQFRTFATEDAQRLTLRLEDGSSVVLGPESELRVPRQLGGATRRVELEGLGYFEVRASSDCPFVVATPRGAIRVLGTKFSARSYPTDSTNTVVVKEGSVRLELGAASDGAARIVEAGHAATHSSARVLSAGAVDVERRLAWRDGRLTFDDAPLRQVVEDLERWYGVDFEIADPSIADERFTGDFSDEPIRRIADVLSLSLGVTYDVSDSTVILSAPDG